MKRNLIVLLAIAFTLAAASAFSIPQVAVLDAVIPDDLDPAVAIPIADKISEELVNSGKYTVLDRAAVNQVLQEKEFQLSSGLVKNEEIRQAGEYLGADLVVAVRASKIGSAYFISARMIDVKSGTIVAQTSQDQRGSIEVLLNVAKVVGMRLAGGVIEEPAEKRAAQAPAAQQPARAPAAQKPVQAPAAARQPAHKPAPSPSSAVYMGFKAGASSANVYGVDWDFDTSAGRRLLFGGYLSMPIGRNTAFEIDALLVQKGYDEEGFDDFLADNYYETWTYNYFEVPFLFKRYFDRGTGFYLAGGGFASLYLGGKREVEFDYYSSLNFSMEINGDFYETDEFISFDFGPVVSAGVDLPIGPLLINLEARYSLGLVSHVSDYYIYQPKHSVFSLIAGLGSRM